MSLNIYCPALCRISTFVHPNSSQQFTRNNEQRQHLRQQIGATSHKWEKV